MMRMSLIDKLKILLDIVKSSKVYILMSILLLLLFLSLIIITKKNSKKKLFISLYIILIGIIIFINKSNLLNMFDYMMNNLFIIIYFPNLAIYLAAIIISNIIMLVSIFSKKMPRFIKNIDITLYSIMTYLLVLVLNIIKENKLDVFTQMSIYSNKNAQAIIELSSTVFMIWISFLLIYKTLKTIIISRKEEKETIEILDKSKAETNTAKAPVVVSEKVVEPSKEKSYKEITPPRIVLSVATSKPSKAYKNCEPPRMVIANTKKKEITHDKPMIEEMLEAVNKPTYEKNYRKIEYPRIAVVSSKPKNEEKKNIEDISIKEYEKLLTLDDYKLLLNILKEQKAKEEQIKSRQARRDREQEKFRELQRLYGAL